MSSLSFWGAAGTITGSKYLVDTGVKDCETFEISWADNPAKADLMKVRFNAPGDMILTLPDHRQRVFLKVS